MFDFVKNTGYVEVDKNDITDIEKTFGFTFPKVLRDYYL